MAHELETGFFVGTPAWHGLGTMLYAPPSIAEALSLAGLDWQVEPRALYLEGSDRPLETGHQAVVRTSDNTTLGVVGPRYTPVQNAKALEPFEPLVKGGLVTLEAAGSLRGGARVWILAKINGAEADVLPGDAVKGYLLFYNGHDGTLSASYQETMIRVVCMNTLSAAVGLAEQGQERRMKLRHTSGIGAQIDDITRHFAVLAQGFQNSLGVYRRLAETPCRDPGGYFRATLRLSNAHGAVPAVHDKGSGGRASLLTMEERDTAYLKGKRQVNRLMELYETQPGHETAPGSLWQAYNAVTYWIDHDRGYTDDARQNASWFGDGPRLRDHALDVARKLIER